MHKATQKHDRLCHPCDINLCALARQAPSVDFINSKAQIPYRLLRSSISLYMKEIFENLRKRYILWTHTPKREHKILFNNSPNDILERAIYLNAIVCRIGVGCTKIVFIDRGCEKRSVHRKLDQTKFKNTTKLMEDLPPFWRVLMIPPYPHNFFELLVDLWD